MRLAVLRTLLLTYCASQAYIFFAIIFALTGVFGSEIWIYNLRNFIPMASLPENIQQMLPEEIPGNVFLISVALFLPVTEFYDSFTRVYKITGMAHVVWFIEEHTT